MSTTSQVTTFIYGLVDPRTGSVRYVGKATNPRRRLSYHLSPSQLKPATHKNHWIRKLLSLGLRPGLAILEEVSVESWREAEAKWIAALDGLTNGTSGGDGLHNPSAETREKCGAARRGARVTFTEEHRAKLAAANRARAQDPAWRKKMSDAMRGNKNGLGRKNSDEHRATLSRLRKAEFAKKSPEERLAFAMRGVAARMGAK